MEKSENCPNSCSPEWHDYVMSLFSPEELSNGNPTVAGLRRVAELLIGPILCSRVVSYFPCSNETSIGRSTVHYEIEFLFDPDKPPQYGIKKFSDVADAWHGNTDDQFSVHAPAIASTRAEARCLRKALKLRVVSAEELTNKDTAKVVLSSLAGTDGERITIEQKNFLDLKCKKNDVNVVSLLKSFGENFTSVDELKREYVAKVIKELDKMTKNNQVPNSVKGYVPNWR